MDIVELIIGTHQVLDDGGLAHAFGGALALAYYAEPRATLDVDVNVFVPSDRVGEVVAQVTPLRLGPERPIDESPPIAGIRLRPQTGVACLDVFVDLDERYAEIASRVRRHPFGSQGMELPFLSPEDLVVFKLSFGREKDWVDLAAIASAGTPVDLDVVEDLLVALRGPSLYPRVARARAIFDR